MMRLTPRWETPDSPGGVPPGRAIWWLNTAEGSLLDHGWADSLHEAMEAAVQAADRLGGVKTIAVNWKSPDGEFLHTFHGSFITYPKRKANWLDKLVAKLRS